MAMAALTVVAIDHLKPGTARREIPDGLVSGLYLTIAPSAKKTWVLRYRVGGRTRKWTIGSFPGIGIPAARKLASQGLVSVSTGGDPAADKKERRLAEKIPQDRDLIEKIAATFIDRYAKKNLRPTSVYEIQRVLNREIVSRWRGRRLSEIGKSDIHSLLDPIADRAPVLANRCLATLRRMCSWAVERGLIEASPCAGIKAPAAEKARDRVLVDDELKTVWQACETIGWPFGPLVRLLILTGQRRGEIAGMRWAEIDINSRTLTLPAGRSKNNREHVLPLSDPVLEILRTLPAIGGKYVFTINGSAPVKGFAFAKRRLDAALSTDIPPWTLHDLRRTFASGCARLGLDLHVVEKCLNHVSGSFSGIVAVYQRHDFASEKRVCMDAWGRHVLTTVSGEPAGNVLEMRARA
jgi:integrase